MSLLEAQREDFSRTTCGEEEMIPVERRLTLFTLDVDEEMMHTYVCVHAMYLHMVHGDGAGEKTRFEGERTP